MGVRSLLLIAFVFTACAESRFSPINDPPGSTDSGATDSGSGDGPNELTDGSVPDAAPGHNPDGPTTDGAGPDAGPTDGSVPTAPRCGATPYQGGVRFRLWAPNAEHVYVAGKFNQWNQTSHELVREPSGFFAIDVPGVPIGDEYRYVIERAGAHLWRSDPCARRLLEGDSYKSVVTDPSSFRWSDGAFAPPHSHLRDAVIYEMHIPTFTSGSSGAQGTFASAQERLADVADLGVNVLQVMPLMENPNTKGFGYGPMSFYAVEAGYGTPDELKGFVGAAHQRGLAAIVDVVFNHMIEGNLLGGFDGTNLYFASGSDGQTEWGPRPNFASVGVREHLTDNLRMWLGEYHFDGARVDSTFHIHSRDDDTALPGGWSLLQSWNDLVRREFPSAIMIAEEYDEEGRANQPTSEGGLGFDAYYDAMLHYALFEAVVAGQDSGRDVNLVAYALGRPFVAPMGGRIIYTENHDKVSLKRRLPVEISPGSPEGYEALKRSTLAAGVLFTAVGIPLLFQGQECVETMPFTFPFPQPIDWTRCERFAGIRALYRDLTRLRRNRGGVTRGLTGDGIRIFHVSDGNKVLAYHRFDRGGAGDDVIVLANFSSRAFAAYEIGFPAGGTWRVRLHSDRAAYHSSFGNTPSGDVVAQAGQRDGLGFHGSVGVGPYSVVILSQ